MAPRTSLTLLLSPVFFLLLSGHCATVTSLSFFYNFSNPKTFSHGGDLQFEGHAFMGDGSIMLAKNREVRDKAGRVSYSRPVYLWSNKTSEVVTGFSTSFSFVIGGINSSNDTGGTLSFFLAPFSPKMPLKSEGGHLLGVFNSATGPGGSQWGVAAVMDSSSHGDFAWDTNMSSVKSKVVDHNLANGVPKILQLDYSDVTKDLVIALQDFTNGATVTIKMSVDLRRHLPQEVAMGFFASTAGSGATVHRVLWWSFCTHTAPVQGNLPNPILARYVLESPDNSSAPPMEGHPGSGGKSNRKVVLGSVVGVVLFAVTAVVVAGLCCIQKLKRQGPMALAPQMEVVEMGPPQIDDGDVGHYLGAALISDGREGQMYSYEEVLNATDNFSKERLLGDGGSCSFYRGDNIGNSDMPVAVKKLEMNSEEEFWKTYRYLVLRIRALAKRRHRNMVGLMGWCRQGKTICLVYEYVENGNLAEHLYTAGRPLPWTLRYKIVLGMASALEYLHGNYVHHGNIKLSTVMLDESFDAKVGDFGMQIQHDPASPELAETLGPESLETTGWEAGMISDVYSFGVVLLEMACGQRPLFPQQDRDAFLAGCVWDMYERGTILEAADERLNGDFDNGEMERALLVGLMCTQPSVLLRPSMREAARMLRCDQSAPILLPRTAIPEPIADVDEACVSADYTLPKPSSP